MKKEQAIDDIGKTAENLKKAVQELREQVDDHLTAINGNTNEIQSNYEYSFEIESKINKLAEKIEEISLFIGLNFNEKSPKMPILTTVEKEVFLAIYALCEEKGYATYQEIAKSINLSETLVMNYLTILLEKGIPIIKSYNDNETKLKISSFFKNLQTKNNILKINEDISKQIELKSYIPQKDKK